jgi:hypothetical protein
MDYDTYTKLKVGDDVLLQLIYGRPRVLMGTITDLGFDLIRQDHYLRVDDGQRIDRTNVCGIRTI